MIVIAIENGKLCPVVTCDNCGERIADYRMGNVVFDDGAHLFFVHRRDCDHALNPERRLRTWMGLGDFLANLCRNAQMPPDTMAEVIATSDEFNSHF